MEPIKKEVRVEKRLPEEDLIKVLAYTKSIQYGSITLTIQDGRIVMIEKNEKIKMK